MAIKDAFKNLIGIPSDEYYNDNEDINETKDDFVDSPMITAVNNQKKDNRKDSNIYNNMHLYILLYYYK